MVACVLVFFAIVHFLRAKKDNENFAIIATNINQHFQNCQNKFFFTERRTPLTVVRLPSVLRPLDSSSRRPNPLAAGRRFRRRRRLPGPGRR